MNSTLTFTGLDWLWVALIALALGAAVLVWSYRTPGPARVRWVGFVLKLAGLAALAWCLLEPLWVGQRAKPGANIFAVVVDNSQGLQVHDRGDAKSRGDRVRDLLQQGATGWQATLTDSFELRRYLFDARLQPTVDLHELAFDGRSTALGSALRSLKERFQGRPLAGVLLLTDGNATDLPGGALPDLAGMPPIYPVVIGKPEAIHDIAIQKVQVSQSSFEDAPVSIQADVVAPGHRGDTLDVRLIDATGKVVQEQTGTAKADADTNVFRFRLKPDRTGLSFYKVDVYSRDERGAEGAEPVASDEATLANNRSVLAVDRGQGPFRVLYVSGRPTWEFKFLNRAVQADDQLELAALIRVAKREPKFEFRGHAGETSNPLFRGFGNQSPEDVERYDRPVLVRLNTRDETELRAGFPRTPEELYKYHAVVLADIEAGFFEPDQALLLQKFVSERGGGLLMLGGAESFANGNYLHTAIGDMLPVYLDPADPGPEQPVGEVQFQLTREGWLQPWARLRDNEADERTLREGMPAFTVVNRVRALKPGASIIASVRDQHGVEFPAVAVQRFGNGRTAAVTVGDLWRWGMRDTAAHTDMDKAWRQLVRWLVSEVPSRVQCTIEPVAADASESVQIRVRVRDQKFQPVDDARVTVAIEPVGFPGSNDAIPAPVKLEADIATAEPGLYEATYVPRQSGGYRAIATVKSGAGEDLGRAEAGWSSDLAAEEFRSLSPNVPLLEQLAHKTGGRVVAADELASFARKLPQQTAPVMETWTRPAWQTPLVLLAAIACFVVEWGLRRWKGMP